MDINTIVLIVILVVMIYALTDHWKEKNTQAEEKVVTQQPSFEQLLSE